LLAGIRIDQNRYDEASDILDEIDLVSRARAVVARSGRQKHRGRLSRIRDTMVRQRDDTPVTLDETPEA
jgi:hypothetical protein